MVCDRKHQRWREALLPTESANNAIAYSQFSVVLGCCSIMLSRSSTVDM